MGYMKLVYMILPIQMALKLISRLCGVSDAVKMCGMEETLLSCTNMAKKQPIEISSLTKRGFLNEERFFRLLSENNNYVDPQTVREFYKGLVTLIKKELHENGGVRLPDIGDMALVKRKAHLGWAGDVQKMIPESRTLIFYPKEALRKHFKLLEDNVVPEHTPSTTVDEYRVEQ